MSIWVPLSSEETVVDQGDQLSLTTSSPPETVLTISEDMMMFGMLHNATDYDVFKHLATGTGQ